MTTIKIQFWDFYVEIHSKIRLCIMYQYAKDQWKHQAGMQSLSNLEEINIFYGWYVVTTFGYHVVWPQKNKTMNNKLFLQWFIFFINVIVTFCRRLACFVQVTSSVLVHFDWIQKYHVVRPLQSVFHYIYIYVPDWQFFLLSYSINGLYT